MERTEEVGEGTKKAIRGVLLVVFCGYGYGDLGSLFLLPCSRFCFKPDFKGLQKSRKLPPQLQHEHEEGTPWSSLLQEGTSSDFFLL